MPTIIDSHVHLYPHYDLVAAIRRQRERLSPGSHALWMLADRAGQDGISLIREALGNHRGGREPTLPVSPFCQYVLGIGAPPWLFIFRGAQVVSCEGLECLMWPYQQMEDRTHRLAELLELHQDPAPLVILPWSPGKWRGARSQLIAEVSRTGKSNILIGDIPMRVPWLPSALTRLMRASQLARGSDPLPLTGEENLIGSFGITSQLTFDPSRPLASATQLLRGAYECHGEHHAAVLSLLRWVRNRARTLG
jgi:hypothetical protein